jgi:hypothetical protein
MSSTSARSIFSLKPLKQVVPMRLFSVLFVGDGVVAGQQVCALVAAYVFVYAFIRGFVVRATVRFSTLVYIREGR